VRPVSGPASGWRPVYRVVCRIPAGQVATYGQVAALSGMPGAARQVGWALSALREEDDVPWHRVVNARGEISPRGGRETVDLQRALLESEGIAFSTRGRIDLACHAWVPGRRRAVRRGASKKVAAKSSGKSPKKARQGKQKPTRNAARKTRGSKS